MPSSLPSSHFFRLAALTSPVIMHRRLTSETAAAAAAQPPPPGTRDRHNGVARMRGRKRRDAASQSMCSVPAVRRDIIRRRRATSESHSDHPNCSAIPAHHHRHHAAAAAAAAPSQRDGFIQHRPCYRPTHHFVVLIAWSIRCECFFV